MEHANLVKQRALLRNGCIQITLANQTNRQKISIRIYGIQLIQIQAKLWLIKNCLIWQLAIYEVVEGGTQGSTFRWGRKKRQRKKINNRTWFQLKQRSAPFLEGWFLTSWPMYSIIHVFYYFHVPLLDEWKIHLYMVIPLTHISNYLGKWFILRSRLEDL